MLQSYLGEKLLREVKGGTEGQGRGGGERNGVKGVSAVGGDRGEVQSQKIEWRCVALRGVARNWLYPLESPRCQESKSSPGPKCDDIS